MHRHMRVEAITVHPNRRVEHVRLLEKKAFSGFGIDTVNQGKRMHTLFSVRLPPFLRPALGFDYVDFKAFLTGEGGDDPRMPVEVEHEPLARNLGKRLGFESAEDAGA